MAFTVRASQGKILNTIGADLSVLDRGHHYLIHLLFEPFVAFFHLLVLRYLIGPEVFIGFGFLVVTVFLQLCFSRCLRLARNTTATSSDMRLKLITDIVSGIRAVKCYGWEEKLRKRADLIRNREMGNYSLLNFLRFTSYCFLRYSGYFASALVFFLKSYRGSPLQAGPAFAAFGAFIFLSLYVCLYFGEGLIGLAEFRSTLNRITETLLLEETDRSHLNILGSSGTVKK